MSVFDALRYEKFMSVYALGGLEKHYLSKMHFPSAHFRRVKRAEGEKPKKAKPREKNYDNNFLITDSYCIKKPSPVCRLLLFASDKETTPKQQCNVSLKLQQQIYGLKIKTLKLCCCRSTFAKIKEGRKIKAHAGKSYFIALLRPSRC
jgi:hypothetical protein